MVSELDSQKPMFGVGVSSRNGEEEMGPGRWLDTLSRDKAMAVAIQLHRDVCLMTLDVLAGGGGG